KQLKENGLKKGNLQIRHKALKQIIRTYTREAGVRGLERQIATLCRKTAKTIISKERKRVIVTEKNLSQWLGKPLYRYGQMEKENQIGAATGLRSEERRVGKE